MGWHSPRSHSFLCAFPFRDFFLSQIVSTVLSRKIMADLEDENSETWVRIIHSKYLVFLALPNTRRQTHAKISLALNILEDGLRRRRWSNPPQIHFSVAHLVQAHRNKFFITKRAKERYQYWLYCQAPVLILKYFLPKDIFFSCQHLETHSGYIFHIICQLCFCSFVGRV